MTMMEKEFEAYWQEHHKSLIAHAPSLLAQERANSTKLNTPGDWATLILPMAVILWFADHGFTHNEILNFIIAVAIGIGVTIPMLLAKSILTGKRNPADIDDDIKKYFYDIYQAQGLKALERMVQT